MDTNAFNDPATMAKATSPTPAGPAHRGHAPAKPPQPAHPRGSPASALPDGGGPKSKRAPPQPAARHGRVDANTAVSGVPKGVAGHSQRQLDGNRSQQFTPPVKRGGLAERLSSPKPHPASNDRMSGLEGAMHAEADRLHPRSRPKATKR